MFPSRVFCREAPQTLQRHGATPGHWLTASSAALRCARSASLRTPAEEPLSAARSPLLWCSSAVSLDTSLLIPSTSPRWVCLALWSSSRSCGRNRETGHGGRRSGDASHATTCAGHGRFLTFFASATAASRRASPLRRLSFSSLSRSTNTREAKPC